MDSKYFKELKNYSKSFLIEELNEKIFDELLNKGFIVKSKEKSETRHEDCFKFDYVGLIILNDIIIHCYPKYINDEKNIVNDFKEIVKVIKRYDDRKDKLNGIVEYGIRNIEEIPFNLISIMLFFIEDYYENGVYTKFQEVIEINGNGEIDWNRTVNENFPIIVNNKPYYTEFQTKSKFNNLFNYFRLLHEYIITECSNYLKNAGILDALGLTPIELSENILDNFGQKDFILNKISKALNLEFNSHKRKLLQLMYIYIKHEDSLSNENSMVLYGTFSYHVIWEDMCKVIFNDELENDKTLIDIIEKPNWILDKKEYVADKSLIPDIITFHEYEEGKLDFIIFDAKYYVYEIKGDKIYHQPGIRSVTKQYLYQLAYKDFIESHLFDKVKNAFLLPFDGEDVKNKGHVELNILSKSCLQLENIQVILLPAHDVNQLYLKDEEMDISRLNLYDNEKDKEC